MGDSGDKTKEVEKLFDSLCDPGSKTLNRSQVQKLLAQLSDEEPSDEETQFILRVCEGLDDDPDSLSKPELKCAVEAWTSYMNQREMLQGTLDTFDKSGNGKLE